MNKLFFLGAFLLLASTQAFAKVGIPIGSREVLEKVHDLPDTDEYKNGSTYVDIGRLHNLDGEKLNKLDFYTRYGGKLVAVAIIGVLVWSGLSRKGKNEDQ